MSREPIFVFVRSVPSARHYALQFMEAIVDHTIVLPPEWVDRRLDTSEWVSFTLKSEGGENRLHFIHSEKMARSRYSVFEWLAVTTHGAILIVDSAMPGQFREFLGLLGDYRIFKWDFPMVVAAVNGQHREAWSVSDLRIAFRLSPDDPVPLISCDVTDTSSVHEAVSELMVAVRTRFFR
jgi:hypothetical protein